MTCEVESDGRLARASVRLVYDPDTLPSAETSTAPEGGSVPLVGWVELVVVVVVGELVETRL